MNDKFYVTATKPAIFFFYYLIGIHSCKAEQPLRGMELQKKKHKKDYRIQKICLERTYS